MKEIFYSRRSINNTTYTIIQTLWKPRGTMIKCYSPCRSETITQFAEAGKQFAAASDSGSTPLTHSCGHNLYLFIFLYCFHVILYNGRRTTNCQGMYAKWSPEHAIKDWFAAHRINVWMPVISIICSQTPVSLQPSFVRTTITTHLATLKNNSSHVIVCDAMYIVYLSSFKYSNLHVTGIYIYICWTVATQIKLSDQFYMIALIICAMIRLSKMQPLVDLLLMTYLSSNDIFTC